jgi:ribosomal protein S18 acetylase RimI-like enzyme
MRDALAGLGQRGWQEVSLWVVEGNDRAISFYQRFGFSFDGARKSHEASGARERRMRLRIAGG